MYEIDTLTVDLTERMTATPRGNSPRCQEKTVGRRTASIQIRLAETEAGIEKLIALGPRLLEESRYRGLFYNDAKLRKAGKRASVARSIST